MRRWRLPIVALAVGLAVLSLAVTDYATSPAAHRGIRVGPLFFPFAGSGTVTAGHSPSTGASGGGSTTGTGSTTGPQFGSSGLKTPIAGLLDRQKAPSPAFYSVLDGWVINVGWASLQPSPGGAITSGNAIDQAIAQVRSANAAGAHLALKLRVFAGTSAPGWAKAIGGAPFTVTDIHSGATGTVGRFWLPAYEAAYADLQHKLAAKYDSVPQIRGVTISGCMTIYAEPLIHQVDDPATARNLWAAGDTVARDEACQTAQVRAHEAWKRTRSELSFNPYQEVLSATQTSTNEDFTQQLMAYCRSTLGARCILMNDSLRATSMGAADTAMYASIKAEGPNIAFQTATMARVGSLSATLSLAVSYGAGSVELPYGYQSTSPTGFAGVRQQLIANARA